MPLEGRPTTDKMLNSTGIHSSLKRLPLQPLPHTTTDVEGDPARGQANKRLQGVKSEANDDAGCQSRTDAVVSLHSLFRPPACPRLLSEKCHFLQCASRRQWPIWCICARYAPYCNLRSETVPLVPLPSTAGQGFLTLTEKVVCKASIAKCAQILCLIAC